MNHHVEFARKLGNIFHQTPSPLARIRDFVFDKTKLLQNLIAKDYLSDAEKKSLAMRELHVKSE